jgi:hypothetical protein
MERLNPHSHFYRIVLFENGRTLCFGEGPQGRLGNDALDSIGIGASAMSLQPYISFSDNNVSAVAATYLSTCVVRCSGAVLCFGFNLNGQLGIGSTLSYGDTVGHMMALNPIGFNPASIPNTTTLDCPTRLLTVSESSGQLTGFSSAVTLYMFTVGASVVSLKVTSATSYPPAATITVNGAGMAIPVALTEHALSSVRQQRMIEFSSLQNIAHQHLLAVFFLSFLLLLRES